MHTPVPSRRNFIKTCAAVSLAFSGLQLFAHCQSAVPIVDEQNNAGYGPLLDDPNGILKLPKGLNYKIISKLGDQMSDGLLVPGRPDGMATFLGPEGKIIIVRNHELYAAFMDESPFGAGNKLLDTIDKSRVYDIGKGIAPSIGGTTTLLYNPATQEVEKEFLSLTGTLRNCAGGPTPWNSWISCEESVARKWKNIEQDHGYNFEVPATLDSGLVKPIPLKAMGRFNHEAVCVDPRTSIVYQTEDRPDGLIYRFIPKIPTKLQEGGKLQALAIKGKPGVSTYNWPEVSDFLMAKGATYEVVWMDLEDIESPKDDLRYRGQAKGAASFARGEGMWFGKEECYFACTNGGAKKLGQVFKYQPSPYEGTTKEAEQPGLLTLFAESDDRKILKYCDNLTVAPWGDVVMAEDHPNPFLVGINSKGEYYKLAENVGYESEFAGVCFSPDGKTLFVNIQHPGLTIAITGFTT